MYVWNSFKRLSGMMERRKKTDAKREYEKQGGSTSRWMESDREREQENQQRWNKSVRAQDVGKKSCETNWSVKIGIDVCAVHALKNIYGLNYCCYAVPELSFRLLAPLRKVNRFGNCVWRWWNKLTQRKQKKQIRKKIFFFNGTLFISFE